MEKQRRQSIISLRRTKRTRSHSESSNVSLGFGHSNKKFKEPCGFLSGEMMSAIKYSAVWTVYVLIGSYLFLVLEKSSSQQVVDTHLWKRYKELLVSGEDSQPQFLEIQKSLYESCPHPLLLLPENSLNSSSGSPREQLIQESEKDKEMRSHIEQVEEKCNNTFTFRAYVTLESKWTYVDAIYYTMTHVTTIGYGHIVPNTRIGRLFAVLYAMIGVPLTCILMATNSNVLSLKLLHIYNNLKKRYSRDSRHAKYMLYFVSWIYLSIGFIVFMFLPSVLFVYLENWTYDESLYYTFITLSTIGFGDYIGGYGEEKHTYSQIYKIGIVVWIMIALSYWVMLLNFLQKALKRKYVPKRIRVQFKAKQLAKQAEFLRQLMSKVRETKPEDGDATSGQHHHLVDQGKDVMSLMAEVAGALNNEVNKGKTSSRKSSLLQRAISHTGPPLSSYQSLSSSSSSLSNNCLTVSSLTSDHEDPSPLVASSSLPLLALSDLVSADVVVRTPKVPIIKSLIERSNERSREANQGKQSLPHANGNALRTGETQSEVTLPLKDVLGLVTIVANLENQMNDAPSLDDTSMYSTIHSMVSMDAKLPMLREAFVNLHSKNQQSAMQNKNTKGPIMYKPVIYENRGKHLHRRESALDVFLEDNTRREYVVVGQEDDDQDTSDPITQEMVTEEMEVPDLEDDGEDTFQGLDTILSLDEDSSEKEDFSDSEERSSNYNRYSRQSSRHLDMA